MEPIKWQSPEYFHSPKSGDWFWALGIIAISIAITSILFNNVLFAVLVLIGAVALVIHHKKIPRVVDFEINEKGIKVGKILHPHQATHAFWIDEEFPNDIRLLLRADKIAIPITVIPLDGVDIEKVRAYLRNHIPEEVIQEPLSQKIMDIIGF